MTHPLRWQYFLFALLTGLALAIPPALASRGETSPDAQLLTAGFLRYHPDLKHRMQGIEAHEAGDHALALREFIAASHYADKASQAMVAEMLWHGIGATADRPAAYAWADLAAERHYKSFLLQRERYWATLDEAEREAALTVGQAIYSEYGDDVAKPRLEKLLRRGSREVTGSRVGFVGNLTIMVPGPNGWTSIDGSTYYADRYWRPDEYFKWQDEVWNEPPSGRVDVGPLGTMAPREAD
jgi:uncharacterized protein